MEDVAVHVHGDMQQFHQLVDGAIFLEFTEIQLVMRRELVTSTKCVLDVICVRLVGLLHGLVAVQQHFVNVLRLIVVSAEGEASKRGHDGQDVRDVHVTAFSEHAGNVVVEHVVDIGGSRSVLEGTI